MVFEPEIDFEDCEVRFVAQRVYLKVVNDFVGTIVYHEVKQLLLMLQGGQKSYTHSVFLNEAISLVRDVELA